MSPMSVLLRDEPPHSPVNLLFLSSTRFPCSPSLIPRSRGRRRSCWFANAPGDIQEYQRVGCTSLLVPEISGQPENDWSATGLVSPQGMRISTETATNNHKIPAIRFARLWLLFFRLTLLFLRPFCIADTSPADRPSPYPTLCAASNRSECSEWRCLQSGVTGFPAFQQIPQEQARRALSHRAGRRGRVHQIEVPGGGDARGEARTGGSATVGSPWLSRPGPQRMRRRDRTSPPETRMPGPKEPRHPASALPNCSHASLG